ncbi:protein-tyrosine phosphatase, partial [Pyronema omphalodes]
PDNFGIVNGCGRVFRSAFPKPENFEALKRLGLKTILTLVSDPYPEENQKFLQDNGITHVQIGMPGNKETQVTPVSDELISEALDVILDTQNHPILIHCNKGKHRTGTVVGCLRKIFGWSVPDSVEEYRHYAGVKVRPHDIMKIRSF